MRDERRVYRDHTDGRHERRRVVVVGSGIGGLAAAWHLAADPTLDVLLLEAAPQIGGKLRSAEVAGVRVDVGAEAMLNRRQEGVALARETGLEIVHPEPVSSRLWTRDALRPLPPSLLGVPSDLAALAESRVLSQDGLAKVRAESGSPATQITGDVSVGELVAARFGDEVVDRLVEPLLGGVYAGRAREISARAAAPQLVAMAERGSLLEQATALPKRADQPVFAGIPGGLVRLPQTLAGSGRFEVRTGCTVRSLARTADGWRLITGPTTDERPIDADAVVLATPAAATGRLLAESVPAAATELARIESASMAVVTMAVRADQARGLEGLGSGFLVPPVDGRWIKAATFSFAKWAWVRAASDGLLLLRTSLGRHGDAAALQVDDAELVRRSVEDLGTATGMRADPVDTHVQRWGGGLPQYAVGHLDRVARIRAAVAEAPELAVCGAAYDGVGIPAVIGSARAAADRVLAGLADSAQ